MTEEKNMDKIDIKGIDKAELLAALHNGTRPLGLGFLHARPDMTAEDARPYLAAGDDTTRMFGKVPRLYFDYLCGRPLKVDIGGDELDPRLYDRDAGQGRAAEVVAKLRERLNVAA